MIVKNDAATTIGSLAKCTSEGKLKYGLHDYEIKNCNKCDYNVYGQNCYKRLAKQALTLAKKQYQKIDDLEYEQQRQ